MMTPRAFLTELVTFAFGFGFTEALLHRRGGLVRPDGEPMARHAIVEGDSPSLDELNDNAAKELLRLARVGDRAAFEELARCLMPAEDAGACWDDARRRLGLAVSSGKIPPGPPDPPSTPHPRRFA